MTYESKYNLQKKLEFELNKLKKKLELGYELKVEWVPCDNGKLAGEVKNNIIYVYEENLDKALEVLKHEFLDYAISKAIEPYKVANKLIMLINEEAYKRKEKLIEVLTK
ncbi:MAG: hypothetical protein QXP78_05515, partial [Candidatus Bathyarchaeia archaeon]